MAVTETTTQSFLPNKSFCFPALVYFFMGIIGAVASIGEISFLSLFVKLLFVFVWTWFLNLLCEKGYSTISWVLVFLPFILFVLIFLTALEVAHWSGKDFKYIDPTSFTPTPTSIKRARASYATTPNK
jgi:hypothetical protein